MGLGVEGAVPEGTPAAVEFKAAGAAIGVGVARANEKVVGTSAGAVLLPGVPGTGSGAGVGCTMTLVALSDGMGAPDGSGTVGGECAPGAGCCPPFGFPPTHCGPNVGNVSQQHRQQHPYLAVPIVHLGTCPSVGAGVVTLKVHSTTFSIRLNCGKNCSS